MLSQKTKTFCSGWEAAIATNAGDDIPSIFNRYLNLFTIYNRLYNEATRILAESREPMPNKNKDSAKATEYVVRYIGAENLLENLATNNNTNSIETIRMILDFGIYHIKLKNSISDRASEIRWQTAIQSEDAKSKADALLQVLYNIRCNMVHGDKDQEDDQRLLLSAATDILRTVTNHLYVLLDQ